MLFKLKKDINFSLSTHKHVNFVDNLFLVLLNIAKYFLNSKNIISLQFGH